MVGLKDKNCSANPVMFIGRNIPKELSDSEFIRLLGAYSSRVNARRAGKYIHSSSGMRQPTFLHLKTRILNSTNILEPWLSEFPTPSKGILTLPIHVCIYIPALRVLQQGYSEDLCQAPGTC